MTIEPPSRLIRERVSAILDEPNANIELRVRCSEWITADDEFAQWFGQKKRLSQGASIKNEDFLQIEDADIELLKKLENETDVHMLVVYFERSIKLRRQWIT